MGLFGWPFRAKPSATDADQSRLLPSSSRTASRSHNAARREVLQLALRETLQRHGIPTSWVTADALAATSRNSEIGLHWRLAIKHWDPRLMLHGVALQHSLVNRVLMYDPVARDWLLGISWQFALPDESACPPMPHPGSWTADPRPEAAPAPAEPRPGGSADLIEGPVRIGGNESKAELDRLMAQRDASFGAGESATGFEATQKLFVKTQASDL